MSRNHAFKYARNAHGVRLMVPKDMDHWTIHNLPDDYDWLDSNQELMDKLLLDLAEGKTLRKFCEENQIPVSGVLARASRDDEFSNLLFNARRYRAEHYHDKLAELAETTDGFTSRADRVKADIYKHLMEVGDRERFGAQSKVTQEASTTVTFIVDTGIRREVASKDEQPRIIDAEVLRESTTGTNERLLAVDGEPQRNDGARADERCADQAAIKPCVLGDSQGGDPSGDECFAQVRHSTVRES